MYSLGKLVNDNIKLNTIWKGFNPKKAPFFTHEDQLYTIEDNKVFNRYNKQAKFLNKKNPIEEIDQDYNANGAPVVLPGNRIAVVNKNQVGFWNSQDYLLQSHPRVSWSSL